MKDNPAKIESGTREHTGLIFEASPNMIIMFDSAFVPIDCNSIAQTYLGFKTKEELLSGFFQRVNQVTLKFQPDGKPSPSLYEHLQIAAREGYSKYETEIHTDRKRNLNVTLNKIPYQGDHVIIAYSSDVTHIREREMELLRARELNELQLAKLRLVVQATKIGLFDMEVVKDDPANPANPMIWSDELRHMLGFENEAEFPNVLSSCSDRLHPEDKDMVVGGLLKHILDKTGETPFIEEFRILKKDGEYAYLHASGETIRDEDGAPLRFVGSAMDITETKNILLDTEKQRVEAEAANQAKSAFLSTMSHEIRTPMNVILGITEIQLRDEKLDPDIKEAFEKIYASSDLLLSIINDILDLSKIEAGKMELIISNYKIASLISDTAQLNMMRIGSKPIQFDLFIDEKMPANLSGDELRVKQILNNILSNAFKYTQSGTVTLSVSFEQGGDDDIVTAVFSVSDTGQGMTREQVALLYDEYSRFNLETNRTTEGTGLGMSITRNLVRMMKGEIIIESEPGKGSVFTVRLPQGRIDSEALGLETVEQLRQFRTTSRMQMKRMNVTREPMPYGRVLVVDDVEANIYVARGLLTPYGLQFDSAGSGFEAIEKIKNGEVYDIVFMDHMMPKMDGIEAANIIRGMGYTHPIVALTANAVTGQADIFLENGFDGFISKPVDLRRLNAILNKLIRDKQPPEVIEAAKQQPAPEKSPAATDTPLPEIDPKFIEIFLRDATKSIAALSTIEAKNGLYDEEDVRTYIIHTHGMKSGLAVIGQRSLSETALQLELLGREGKRGSMASELPAFLDSLRALTCEFAPKKDPGDDDGDAAIEDQPYLREKLLAVKAACEEYDEQTADAILEELMGKAWPEPTRALLGAIAADLLHGDFDEISRAIDGKLSL